MQNRQELRGQERRVSRNPGSSRLVQWSAVTGWVCWQQSARARQNHCSQLEHGSDRPICVCCRVRYFVTPWTVAHQAPLSMGFPREEVWSGLPCPPPGDLPDPGSNPCLMSPALAGGVFTTSATWGRLPWCLVNHTPPGPPSRNSDLLSTEYCWLPFQYPFTEFCLGKQCV